MFSQTWYHSSCSKAQQTTQSENEPASRMTTWRQQREMWRSTPGVLNLYFKKWRLGIRAVSPCNQINPMIMLVYCNLCLIKHDIIPLVSKPNKPANQKMKKESQNRIRCMKKTIFSCSSLFYLYSLFALFASLCREGMKQNPKKTKEIELVHLC